VGFGIGPTGGLSRRTRRSRAEATTLLRSAKRLRRQLLQDIRGTTIKGRRKGFGCNDGELRGDGLSVSRQGVFTDSLTEILRSGARAVLTQAVEAEVADFLAKHADLRSMPEM